MAFQVEFFGVARHHAGMADLTVLPGRQQASVREILQRVCDLNAGFSQHCWAEDGLRPEYILSVDGQRFLRDGDATVDAGQCLLVMSADAGG